MQQQGTSPTIMVVDDDEDVRLLMRKWLEMNGYRVVEAKDGDEAVEIAQQEHPRLILMDIGLPQRSGISATYRIRSQPELNAVSIVTISAYDSTELRDDAFKAGCNNYLIKPIDVDQLKDVLNRLLPTLPEK